MLQILDVVALLSSRSDLGLARGQVGTVVERYGDSAVEVEFADDNGATISLASFPDRDLLKLVHQAAAAAA